ncbi:MAG: hypothetical protein AAF467_25035 [Actinomycetota bacterium]
MTRRSTLARHTWAFLIVAIAGAIAGVAATTLTLDGNAPAEAQTPIAESSATYERNVMVVVYDPILASGDSLTTHLGWSRHTEHTVDFFERVTDGKLSYNISIVRTLEEFPLFNSGHRYTENEYLNVALPSEGDYATNYGMYNYEALLNDDRLRICDKVNDGTIDEVWLYAGPHMGLWESTMAGPNAYWLNSQPVPDGHDCNELVVIMGPSMKEAPDQEIHNFTHRMESALDYAYGPRGAASTPTNWDRFSFTSFDVAAGPTLLSPTSVPSGCGESHFPANANSSAEADEYDYDNAGSFVRTYCDDFLNYPNLTPNPPTEVVNCTEWAGSLDPAFGGGACNAISFYHYWFTHIPKVAGCNDDGRLNDWWAYFVHPEMAINPICSVPDSNSPRTGTANVTAQGRWQTSGIAVDGGATVTIEVTGGAWNHIPSIYPDNQGLGPGPTCVPSATTSCDDPLPGQPGGSLIGRIGDEVFMVGEGTELTAPGSGFLYLRINDHDRGLFDNTGELTVDVSSTAAPPSSECSVLANGGFEAGLDGWTIDGNTALSSDAVTGNSSANLDFGSWLEQRVPAEPGATYQLSGMVKTDPEGVDYSINLNFYDANGSYITGAFAFPTSADWTEFSLQAQGTADTAFVEVWAHNHETGFARFDDLALEALPCGDPEPEPVPTPPEPEPGELPDLADLERTIVKLTDNERGEPAMWVENGQLLHIGSADDYWDCDAAAVGPETSLDSAAVVEAGWPINWSGTTDRCPPRDGTPEPEPTPPPPEQPTLADLEGQVIHITGNERGEPALVVQNGQANHIGTADDFWDCMAASGQTDTIKIPNQTTIDDNWPIDWSGSTDRCPPRTGEPEPEPAPTPPPQTPSLADLEGQVIHITGNERGEPALVVQNGQANHIGTADDFWDCMAASGQTDTIKIPNQTTIDNNWPIDWSGSTDRCP